VPGIEGGIKAIQKTPGQCHAMTPDHAKAKCRDPKNFHCPHACVGDQVNGPKPAETRLAKKK